MHAFDRIGCTVIDARILLLTPSPSWRRATSLRRRRFFLRVVGELAFHYIVVECALLVDQVNAVERKPCAQWSPPGPVS